MTDLYKRRAVESLLLQALRHDLKAEAWPLARDVPHWRAEARLFRAQARLWFVPSMQHLDLAGLYGVALATLPKTLDGLAPLPLPPARPVTLAELLGDGV